MPRHPRQAAVPDVYITGDRTIGLFADYVPIPPRRDAFGIRGRFGGGYAALADSGTWNLGLGFSYTVDPRLAFELRGDFQLPSDQGGAPSGLSSAWVSLNFLWYFRIAHTVQPYLIAGFAVAIAPEYGDPHATTAVAAGGQGGIGVEILIRRVIGISFEAVGFVAGHRDDLLEGGVSITTALSWYI